jgi:transposase
MYRFTVCIKYKGQQSVERGFRFLKEPAFMTPSVFLKSQKRIIALAMGMCLCLLVYMIAQHYLRHRLEQARASVPNQLGKSTRTPTMRWIFQLFEGVHLLIHKTLDGVREIILNMNPLRYHILAWTLRSKKSILAAEGLRNVGSMSSYCDFKLDHSMLFSLSRLEESSCV